MDNNNEDVEIDLLRLCRYIISKWNVILLSSIVFATLGFAFKYYSIELSNVPFEEMDKQIEVDRLEKQPDGRVVKVKKAVPYKIYKEEYDGKMKAYNAEIAKYELNKKIFANKIKLAQRDIEQRQDYLEKSIIYNTDVNHYYETVYFYNVKNIDVNLGKIGGGGSAPDHSSETSSENISSERNDVNSININSASAQNSAVTFASTLVNSYSFFHKVAKRLKISLTGDTGIRFLRELINLEIKDTDSFEIHLRANSAEMMKILVEELEYFNKRLKDYCGENFNIVIEMISSGKTDANGLIAWQTNEMTSLYSLQKKLEDVNIQSSELIEPIKFDGYDKYVELNDLKRFKIMKFCIAGFVFGLFLSSFFYVLKYIMDGKLKDLNYISSAFNITKLACIHVSKNSNADIRAVETIDENLRYIIGQGHRQISFVSTLTGTSEKDLTEVKSVIDKYNSMNGIVVKLVDPSEIQQIASSEIIIIAERLDVSVFDKVVDEVKNIVAIKKQIYGIVYA